MWNHSQWSPSSCSEAFLSSWGTNGNDVTWTACHKRSLKIIGLWHGVVTSVFHLFSRPNGLRYPNVPLRHIMLFSFIRYCLYLTETSLLLNFMCRSAAAVQPGRNLVLESRAVVLGRSWVVWELDRLYCNVGSLREHCGLADEGFPPLQQRLLCVQGFIYIYHYYFLVFLSRTNTFNFFLFKKV